ncbi:MAG: P-II family nitrogen regulator [Clostridia bacterium]|nr:P-II family nitrogen regulator [Clostridia bacterium]
MNYIISIINPDSTKKTAELCKELSLTLTVAAHAKGTAIKSMLDLLGIESTERSVVFTVANDEKTETLIKNLKRKIHIGVPGHGIVISVPIKSVGGGKTLSYLNGNEPIEKHIPKINPSYELITVISNEGSTDIVMNAARAAGARGGTVIHGKGTQDNETAKFYNVSIASEKEIILIVSTAEQKAEIMKSILQSAGPATKAGSIAFSVPVTDVAGFGFFDED